MSYLHLTASISARKSGVHRNCATFVAKPASRPAKSTAEPLTLMADPQPVKYELKGPSGSPFTISEGQLGAVLGASVGLLTRAGTGALVAGYKPSLETAEDGQYAVVKTGGRMLKETSSLVSTFKRPAKPIEVYEFDACPFCKKVREMCSYLDLDVLYRPCPSGGPTFRPAAVKMGGKSSFPYMVDPNTSVAMYESDDIIAYLAKEYGNGEVPLMLRLGAATVLTAGLGGIARIGKGARYRPSRMPGQPLIVWGYETSPFVRLVKERLTELELPHLFKNTARGSPKREEMFAEWGKFQVPFLQDPNTGVAMFESAAIIDYLEETYALKA